MENSNLVIFQDAEGKARVTARFCDDNVWLTHSQLAEIYSTTKPNIVQHLNRYFLMENYRRRQLLSFS